VARLPQQKPKGKMKTIKFKNWTLIVDEELTKSTYKKAEIGSASSCVCNECKNYSAYRENVFPEEIKKLFSEIGIDYNKESEITRYCKQKNGLHFYGGWFHFKGEFIGENCKNKHEENSFTFELTKIEENFRIGFHLSSALSFFEDKNNLVQIEFETEIPWVIEKELETE
jgi:hypothetical protein